MARVGHAGREVEGLRSVDPAARSHRLRPERLRRRRRRARCAVGQRHAARARARRSSATPPTSSSTACSSAARASTSARCTARCCVAARPLPRRRPCWRTSRRYLLAGVVQRTMYRLRSDVEDKLNRLPLALRRPPAPRRPAQPGHQRHRQHRPEPAADAEPDAHVDAARIVGVLVMMFVDLAAAGARRAGHRSRSRCSLVTVDRQPVEDAVHRPVAPHRHAQRPGRGGVHRPRAREGVRPPGATSRRRFDEKNEELYEASFGAQFISGHHPAGDDVPRQPQLRRHRRDRRAAGVVRAR